MPGLTDSAFVSAIREELAKAIADNKEKLVKTPTERIAGHIQGLEQSLAVIDQTYSKANAAVRGRPLNQQQ